MVSPKYIFNFMFFCICLFVEESYSYIMSNEKSEKHRSTWMGEKNEKKKISGRYYEGHHKLSQSAIYVSSEIFFSTLNYFRCNFKVILFLRIFFFFQRYSCSIIHLFSRCHFEKIFHVQYFFLQNRLFPRLSFLRMPVSYSSVAIEFIFCNIKTRRYVYYSFIWTNRFMLIVFTLKLKKQKMDSCLGHSSNLQRILA